MVDFTWSITSAEAIPDVDGKIQVINTLTWEVKATDGDNETTLAGNVTLPLPEKGKPFTAFEDLTPDLVMGWAKDVISTETVQHVEELLITRLAEVAAPVKEEVRLPWVPEKEVPPERPLTPREKMMGKTRG